MVSFGGGLFLAFLPLVSLLGTLGVTGFGLAGVFAGDLAMVITCRGMTFGGIVIAGDNN